MTSGPDASEEPSHPEDALPDIEKLWRETVREAPRREAEQRGWIEQQVYEAIRRARRGHDHLTAVNLWVLVPICMACVHSESRWVEEDPDPPEVFGTDWTKDYSALGFSRRQVTGARQALENGSWRLRCDQCGSTIDVVGEGFRTRRVDFSGHFGLTIHEGKKPPVWMKRAVLRAFGTKCAACRKRLSIDEATFDHIVARSKGGLTEMANLQPLCQKCNGTKADQDVASLDVVLTFRLRPAPSDGCEGVIW